MNMSPYTLTELLDDDIDYEDIGKDKFIEKLNDRFNDHKTQGDSELLLDLDYCKGCNCNRKHVEPQQRKIPVHTTFFVQHLQQGNCLVNFVLSFQKYKIELSKAI